MSVPYNFPDKNFKEITGTSNIPEGRSYVIQFYENYSVHHEGDQRSKDAPGHGYPAYTENILKVRQFVTPSRNAWEETLKCLSLTEHKDFVGLICDRPSLKKTVEVRVELPTNT
jgi:hypothetical protein